MSETAATLPRSQLHFHDLLRIKGLLKSFLKLQKQQDQASVDVLARMTDAQRADLGFENPPLPPVSRFQGFELETSMVILPSDALQYCQLRGIDK